MNEMRLKEIEREFEFYGRIPNDTTDFADLLEAAKEYHSDEYHFSDVKNEIRWNADDIIESADNIQEQVDEIEIHANAAFECAGLNDLPQEFVELFCEQIEFIKASLNELRKDLKIVKELSGTIKTEVS